MSMQTVARQVFTDALPGLGRWDPVVFLGIVGDEMFHACGFTGSLDSLDDLDGLTEEQARMFCEILPNLIRDLPPPV